MQYQRETLELHTEIINFPACQTCFDPPEETQHLNGNIRIFWKNGQFLEPFQRLIAGGDDLLHLAKTDLDAGLDCVLECTGLAVTQVHRTRLRDLFYDFQHLLSVASITQVCFQ